MKNLILAAAFSLLCLTINTQLNAQSHSSTKSKSTQTSISLSGSFGLEIDTDDMLDWLYDMLDELEADGLIESAETATIKYDQKVLKVNSQKLGQADFEKYEDILLDHFDELNSIYVNRRGDHCTVKAKN